MPDPTVAASRRERLRRVVSALAVLTLGLGGVGAALFGFDLGTRPPCEPGYVRLVDLEPAVPIVSLVLAALSLVLFWRARRGAHLALLAAVSVAVLVSVVFVDLSAVVTLVHHHGARYDADCWTF